MSRPSEQVQKTLAPRLGSCVVRNKVDRFGSNKMRVLEAQQRNLGLEV